MEEQRERERREGERVCGNEREKREMCDSYSDEEREREGGRETERETQRERERDF